MEQRVTGSKGVLAFWVDRDWVSENVAKRLKPPRNLVPNEAEPYTQQEEATIIDAYSIFGRGQYERFRARAMVLILRYTALRLGDVAKLSRDRITWDQERRC